MNTVEKSIKLTMFEYFIKCIKRYFDFKGRASRVEFWSYILLLALIFTWVLLSITFLIGIFNPCRQLCDSVKVFITCIICLPLIIPCLSLTVRRLHDLNKSGLYVILPTLCLVIELFLLFPKGIFSEYYWFIASFTMLVYFLYTVFFFMKKGLKGNNKYGEDSLEM